MFKIKNENRSQTLHWRCFFFFFLFFFLVDTCLLVRDVIVLMVGRVVCVSSVIFFKSLFDWSVYGTKSVLSSSKYSRVVPRHSLILHCSLDNNNVFETWQGFMQYFRCNWYWYWYMHVFYKGRSLGVSHSCCVKIRCCQLSVFYAVDESWCCYYCN